jgi:hypothetical protein
MAMYHSCDTGHALLVQGISITSDIYFVHVVHNTPA